jgi:hypothetical protein
MDTILYRVDIDLIEEEHNRSFITLKIDPEKIVLLILVAEYLLEI